MVTWAILTNIIIILYSIYIWISSYFIVTIKYISKVNPQKNLKVNNYQPILANVTGVAKSSMNVILKPWILPKPL